MKFTIVDQETASKAIEYFNFFHDGFIRRIEIISQDKFTSNGSQRLTGEFFIVINFCHHNYRAGHNYKQMIRASFKGVSLFSLNTSEFKKGERSGWYINEILIEKSGNEFKLMLDKKCLLAFAKATFKEL